MTPEPDAAVPGRPNLVAALALLAIAGAGRPARAEEPPAPPPVAAPAPPAASAPFDAARTPLAPAADRIAARGRREVLAGGVLLGVGVPALVAGTLTLMVAGLGCEACTAAEADRQALTRGAGIGMLAAGAAAAIAGGVVYALGARDLRRGLGGGVVLVPGPGGRWTAAAHLSVAW